LICLRAQEESIELPEKAFASLSGRASHHLALNYTTSQSLDFRSVDFETIALILKFANCGEIQNSNSASIQEFDLSSSSPVPRQDGTIVWLLSRIVGYGNQRAGTTSPLYSYSPNSELSKSAGLLSWLMLIYSAPLFAGWDDQPAEAHLNPPAPAGCCTWHYCASVGAPQYVMLGVMFCSLDCCSLDWFVARVKVVFMSVVAMSQIKFPKAMPEIKRKIKEFC